MIKINKKVLLIFAIFIVSFFVITTPCYPVISHNGSGGGYDGGGDGKRTTYSPIEDYIIEGAGYYLAANANVQKILQMVELQDLQGIDYAELAAVIDSAVFNMMNAVETFERLIDKAEATPYNENVIALLKGFDYNTFMLKNGLNSTIFNTAAGYLKSGDITGVFKHTYKEYLRILETLIVMKFSIAFSKLPELPAFWKLNEAFAKASLFGSIIARIFAAIQQP